MINCPWLRGNGVKQCGAVGCPVVLSIFELEEYCSGGGYSGCPVFRARRRLRKDLDVDQYFAQFSASVMKHEIKEER